MDEIHTTKTTSKFYDFKSKGHVPIFILPTRTITTTQKKNATSQIKKVLFLKPIEVLPLKIKKLLIHLKPKKKTPPT